MNPYLYYRKTPRRKRATSQRLVVYAVVLTGSFLSVLGYSSIALADSVTLSPSSMKMYRGEASKSAVEPLASNDQRGQSDNWDSYVEFYPASNGMASVLWFEAPVDIASQALESIEMKTNFKGPAWVEQPYTWYLRNFATSRWVSVGTNKGLPDWSWTQQSFQSPDNADDFINPLGQLAALFRTRSSH